MFAHDADERAQPPDVRAPVARMPPRPASCKPTWPSSAGRRGIEKRGWRPPPPRLRTDAPSRGAPVHKGRASSQEPPRSANAAHTSRECAAVPTSCIDDLRFKSLPQPAETIRPPIRTLDARWAVKHEMQHTSRSYFLMNAWEHDKLASAKMPNSRIRG